MFARAQYSAEFIIIVIVNMINALFIQNMMKSYDRWSFTFDLLVPLIFHFMKIYYIFILFIVAAVPP